MVIFGVPSMAIFGFGKIEREREKGNTIRDVIVVSEVWGDFIN